MAKKRVKQEPDAEPESTVRSIVQTVTTPAGYCPIALEDFTDDGVRQWIADVRKNGESVGVHYAIESLVYWLREFADIHSLEYFKLREQVYTLALGA